MRLVFFIIVLIHFSSMAKISYCMGYFGGSYRLKAKSSESITLGYLPALPSGAGTSGEYSVPGVKGQNATNPNTTTDTPQIGNPNVTLDLDFEKKIKGFFGAIIEVKFPVSAIGFDFGAVGIFGRVSQKNLNSNQGVEKDTAGTSTKPLNNLSMFFKNRGLLLFAGPAFALRTMLFELHCGFATTFSGYSLKAVSPYYGFAANALNAIFLSGATTPGGVTIPLTSYRIRTKKFNTLGVMPFAKIKIKFGNMHFLVWGGYNFSKPANLKVISGSLVPYDSQNRATASLVEQTFYNYGLNGYKVKTSALFFGSGAMFKF
jgi:hypothetical protein